jgi:hypothetical protein
VHKGRLGRLCSFRILAVSLYYQWRYRERRWKAQTYWNRKKCAIWECLLFCTVVIRED